LTPQEKAAFAAIQSSSEVGAEVLENVIGEFRDAVKATGGTVGAPNTVPNLVRVHVINRTRWLWLCEFPALKSIQTEGRKELNEAAEKMLRSIMAGEVRVPGPTESDNSGGSWNSENKIVMRTHPVPTPSEQGSSTYANPDAPADS
jgi:hypothetical protein